MSQARLHEELAIGHDIRPTLIAARVRVAAHRGQLQRGISLLHTVPASVRPLAAWYLYALGVPADDPAIRSGMALAAEPDPYPLLLAGAFAADQKQWSELDRLRGIAHARAGSTAAAGDSAGAALYTEIARAFDGYAAFRQGRLAEALTALDQAQKATVGHGISRSNINNYLRRWIAEVHAEAGRPEEAIRYLQTLIHVDAVFRLAQLYDQLGRTEEARLAYAESLAAWSDADPGFSMANEARQALARLAETAAR